MDMDTSIPTTPAIAATTGSSITYRGKSAAQINRSMKLLLPETNGCTYADYPLTSQSGKWLAGDDKAPQEGGGGYCFLRTGDTMPTGPDGGFKTGYVWGTGPLGYGYYHLLTKAAHATLYFRIHEKKVFTGRRSGASSPKGGLFGSKKSATSSSSDEDPKNNAILSTTLPTIPAGDLADLRLLFHARSVATKPNDAQAYADQLSASQSFRARW
jgi:hypothetical protein